MSLYKTLPVESNKFMKSGNVVKAKKLARKMSEIEDTPLNILLMGPQESGKTFTIVSFLLQGYKVFHLDTDIGNDGLVTVKNELRRLNKLELLDNLVTVTLDTYEEVESFLDNPESYFKDFYSFGFSIIYWNGFANFHNNHINVFVGDMTPVKKDGSVSEQRDSGLQFEVQDWGMVRRATLKCLDKFFRINNKIDGTLFHKIVTCHIKVVSKKIGNSNVMVEVSQPLISGASQILMGAAFDLIIETKINKSPTGSTSYQYIIGSDGENFCKNRGFNLDKKAKADFGEVWNKICDQAGIKKDAKNKEYIEKE